MSGKSCTGALDALEAFGLMMLEGLFRSCIEDGTIQIESRSFEDIHTEFVRVLAELTDDPYFSGEELWPVFDHQEQLRIRAHDEVVNGDSLIGVTLYVIWFEHVINGILIRQFERQQQARDVYMPIIRRLDLQTKLTSIWKLLQLPDVPDEHLKLLHQAIELRNGFVHYKWIALSHSEADQQLARCRSIADQMEQLASYFDKLADSVFWAGRENEIIDQFRATLKAKAELDPPLRHLQRVVEPMDTDGDGETM